MMKELQWKIYCDIIKLKCRNLTKNLKLQILHQIVTWCQKLKRNKLI